MRKRGELWAALGMLAGGALFAAILGVLTYQNSTGTVRHPDIEETVSRRAMSASESNHALLYGRVTARDGTVYEGRLRWGGHEEALWSNYFNGFKPQNPWVGFVRSELLPKNPDAIEILGMKFLERPIELGRPFMARFGDIARIEGHGRDIQVTLRSGTVVHLDSWEANDFNDGVRVWDESHGVVDIAERGIRSIEFLPTPQLRAAPGSLYGTVRTQQGDFTGLVQWDGEQCLDSDTLEGGAGDKAIAVAFDTIRSIARQSADVLRVTLENGREMVVSGRSKGSRGIYVDDARYGRVLIRWDVFERIDFNPDGSGPAYGDFTPGEPFAGRVTTRDGRRLAGRLVYDLDESETTDTLDAASRGIDYALPFGLLTSISLAAHDDPGAHHAIVTLSGTEKLALELTGDLSSINAGVLVFGEGPQQVEYVRWGDIDRIDFDRK
jgi:hypothetical protein